MVDMQRSRLGLLPSYIVRFTTYPFRLCYYYWILDDLWPLNGDGDIVGKCHGKSAV